MIDCPLEKYSELNRDTLQKFLDNDERERFFDILKIIEKSFRHGIELFESNVEIRLDYAMFLKNKLNKKE